MSKLGCQLCITMFVLVIVLIAGPGSENPILAQAAPTATHPVEIGAFVDSSPPTVTKIREFENLAGRHVYSLMWYEGWSTTGAPSFPATQLVSVRYHDGYDTHVVLHVTWEPWVALKDISNGVYDASILRYANDARDWGEPIRLRFAHEMIQDNIHNNCQGQPTCPEWYPWQDQPTDYVNAFRHVHDIFQSAGATNVQFVWSPNNYPFDLAIVQQYYPGPGYMDWLGMDGYNRGNQDGKPGWPDWQWFDDLFYNIYHTFVDHKDIFGDKPIMVGEFASCEAGPYDLAGQTKAAWIQNTFDRIKSPDYAAVHSFYWFQINKECNWRVDSSPQSLIAFQTAMSSSDFVGHPIPAFIIYRYLPAIFK